MIGKTIEWRGVNRIERGVVERVQKGDVFRKNEDGELVKVGESVHYVAKLASGKYVMVNAAGCREVEQTAKPERRRYEGRRFGEGNRVIPNLHGEIDVTKVEVLF